MNTRIWGIIGGVALVLALLSPLVLGNSKKIEQLYEAAEALYERSDYAGAIVSYKKALKESKKFGAKTETIDKDFNALINLKIAWCYYELAEKTSDVRYYQTALTHIREVVLDAHVPGHQEELTYLWAENLYKIRDLDQAESKFSWLIEKFPNSLRVPEALYAIGEITYQQENCEKALSTFQRLITEFPQSEFEQRAESRIVELNQVCGELDPPIPDPIPQCEAMYNAASDLQQQGKVHDAYELYTDIITNCPESEHVTDAYIGKAEIHLEAKNYVNARTNYEKAIDSTTDEERRRELYVAYHRTHLVPDPVIDDRKRREPTDEPFVIARLLRLEKRWLEAAETYEKLTNRNLSVEEMVYTLYWEGRCYYEAAKMGPALFSKSVDALTKLNTDYENSQYNIKPYYYLTLAYTDWAEVSGDLSKCQSVIDTFEKANAKYADSNDGEVQELLSHMRRLNRDAIKKLYPLIEEAERAIKNAEREIANAKRENKEPQLIHQANEHLEEAKRQMSINNHEETISEAKKVSETLEPIPLPPSPDPQRYVDGGHRDLERGELENALEKVEQALNLNRNYAPARELKSEIRERYSTRGRRHFEEEKYDEAIEAFENAISIDIHPKLKEPYNYLGVIHIGQEKYREAIEAFTEAIEIDENFKEAYYNRSLAHLELGELEEAIEDAEAALRIDPNYEPARMLIEFIAD